MITVTDNVVFPWPSNSGGVVSTGSNSVSLLWVYMPAPITISGLVFERGPGDKFGVGIYSEAGSLLVDSGPIASGVIVTAISPAVFLGSGMYWLAYTQENLADSVRAMEIPSNAIALLCEKTASSVLATAANSSSGGQLPSTTGVITRTALGGAPGSGLFPIIRFY